MQTKIDVHERICKELNELYARKNADYGDSFGKSFKEYGLTMACIRLEDKLNRIKALTKQTAQVSDESIEDTLMDLANYSIMTLVELAEDEKAPENAPESMRGEHECLNLTGARCLCNTCAKDRDMDDVCCIVKYGYGSCCISECPDYVKEDPDA